MDPKFYRAMSFYPSLKGRRKKGQMGCNYFLLEINQSNNREYYDTIHK